MAEKTEQTIRVVLESLRNIPDGEIVVDELNKHFGRTMSKSGGSFTGGVGHRNVDKEPAARPNEFVQYTRTLTNGTLEWVSKDPGGNITVLDSYTP